MIDANDNRLAFRRHRRQQHGVLLTSGIGSETRDPTGVVHSGRSDKPPAGAAGVEQCVEVVDIAIRPDEGMVNATGIGLILPDYVSSVVDAISNCA